jgi:hypothetical protein
MNQDIKTLELAKTYEAQGYFKDAFDMYVFLDTQASSQEIKAGIKRMELKLDEQKINGQNSADKNIAALFEKWVKLLVLKQRLDNFKKIKARLV